MLHKYKIEMAKVVIDIKSFTLLENVVSSPPPIYLPTENGDEMTASRDLTNGYD